MNVRQGLDCCTFDISFSGELKDIQIQPLKNSAGRKYGTIEVKDGKAILHVVLPWYLRQDNMKPFTLSDSINLELIKSDCMEQVSNILGNGVKSEVKSIECNITQKVSGRASQSDVLNLLSKATLNCERDTIKYVAPSKRCKLKEETHTVIATRSHYYTIKAYDKTEQLIRQKKSLREDISNVPDGLLRIEIIMFGRTLDRLFGTKNSIADILTKESLMAILHEYKRILCTEIIDYKVKPYLDLCVTTLMDSICEFDSVASTVAKERELIPDKEVLRRCIKRYQSMHGRTDNSLRDSEYYCKKFELPQNVLLTLGEFREACG